MKKILLWFVLTLVWAKAVSTQGAVGLTVGSVEGSPGGSVAVPIQLTGNTSAVAVQFELLCPIHQLLTGAVVGGSALAEHQAGSNEPAPGTRRVLIYSLTNALLNNGVLVTIPVTIQPNATNAVTSLLLTNVVLANAQAQRLEPVDLVSGQVNIRVILNTRLSSLTRTMNGQVELLLSEAGTRTYILQGSTDLLQWLPLQTNTALDGTIIYMDRSATNFTQRFYRAVQAP